MVSIVIPCKNDQEVLNATIDSILKTVNIKYEIIVVDDGSKEKIKSPYAKVIRHKQNIGVGAAIDTGVKQAKYNNIVISGSDMFYFQQNWAKSGVELLNNDRKVIWSTCCIGKHQDGTESKRYGCDMIIKSKKSDLPKDNRYPENWKMLFRSKWYSDGEINENMHVPSILGACYFIDKSWYLHLKGFALHRYWGTLDSQLAIKSWLAGGACRCATRIQVGHKFGRPSTNSKPKDWFIYNKIVVAKTLFPEKEKELLDWIKGDKLFQSGLNLANGYLKEIKELKEYYMSIFVRDYNWYVNKFNLK